ncbi:MAG: TerC family protein [Burkholderiaceae bacterium]
MIELLTTLNWAAVGQIIMIDILLGGDNAVVIALACRNLPPEQRTKGILFGTIGAIGLRVILIIFAMSLLSLPWLKLVGGLLLLWIGVKLLTPEDDGDHGVGDGGTSLLSAIRTVIIADLVMSIDNVIGISAAAQRANEEHQFALVIFGLLVSVPIIIWGSKLVLGMMEKYRFIIWIGAMLLGWIAGGMMVTDPVVEAQFGVVDKSTQLICEIVGALSVAACAWLLFFRRPAESPRRS